MTTITVHVAPSLLTHCLALSTISIAVAHVKWYNSTVKTGKHAVAAIFQQKKTRYVVEVQNGSVRREHYGILHDRDENQ